MKKKLQGIQPFFIRLKNIAVCMCVCVCALSFVCLFSDGWKLGLPYILATGKIFCKNESSHLIFSVGTRMEACTGCMGLCKRGGIPRDSTPCGTLVSSSLGLGDSQPGSGMGSALRKQSSREKTSCLLAPHILRCPPACPRTLPPAAPSASHSLPSPLN